VDELVERTKVKYKANTNPFHDRPVADGKRQSALGRAQSKGMLMKLSEMARGIHYIND
jgi:hypothetical protein